MPTSNHQQPAAGTSTWHLHLEGQVQGVGFRPFVYRLAGEHGLNGWVNNTVDGVHVEINAGEAAARTFLDDLIEKAPRLSRIVRHRIEPAEEQVFTGFNIIQSHAEGPANLLLTPDFAICEDCRKELLTPENRRFGYPFITCTNCGPRFSIARTLPYDRETTTMAVFKMCPVCEAEYENPLDRRYYSQTNSCPKCPVELQFFTHAGALIPEEPGRIIELVSRLWEEGKIIAIKGIGGYLLTCDAANDKALETLRQRKHRPSKPFALMFPDIETLRRTASLRPEEADLLLGPESPVVLVESEPSMLIAPGLSQTGAMLPYTPLYELLLRSFGKPIVATSGNRSNSPIVFRDEKALDDLGGIADFILTNNREIAVPQDDSVVRFTPFHKKKIILRRSRGMAPTFINSTLAGRGQNVFAGGAMMKSTFALLHRQNIYLSQYLGDLESFETEENYRHTVQHFFRLLGAKPDCIVADKHPNYPSTIFSRQLAADLGIPFKTVQHHLAHFAAVLGEYLLTDQPEPVLGVIWDGTGLGDDGMVWGGEFFSFANGSFRRSGHFGYFNFILGDKMPREPRISALSACHGLDGAELVLRKKFTETEWRLYTSMLNKGSALQTSSVGRIFDAVASLLGVSDLQTYEGEAAMLLENRALRYLRLHGLAFSDHYPAAPAKDGVIPTAALMQGILQDLQAGLSRDFIAAKFHYSLAVLVKTVARQSGLRKIAFSGGVFQNSVLVDFIIHCLGQDFELYFHEALSPNDENVAFGQLVLEQSGFDEMLL